MKNLRRLGLSLTLISVLAMAAFAGETNSPPCAPPEPGETNSPPCAAAQMTSDDNAATGEIGATAPSDTPSVVEVAMEALQGALFLVERRGLIHTDSRLPL